jgi:signal peptidase II
VSLGLVLGGALGNLADRLFRPPGPFRGRVIDFVDFRVWPTFNLADAAVVCGAIVLALASLRGNRSVEPR